MLCSRAPGALLSIPTPPIIVGGNYGFKRFPKFSDQLRNFWVKIKFIKMRKYKMLLINDFIKFSRPKAIIIRKGIIPYNIILCNYQMNQELRSQLNMQMYKVRTPTDCGWCGPCFGIALFAITGEQIHQFLLKFCRTFERKPPKVCFEWNYNFSHFQFFALLIFCSRNLLDRVEFLFKKQ